MPSEQERNKTTRGRKRQGRFEVWGKWRAEHPFRRYRRYETRDLAEKYIAKINAERLGLGLPPYAALEIREADR